MRAAGRRSASPTRRRRPGTTTRRAPRSPCDAGERLFGLDAQPGSLDRVGTTRSLDPHGASPDAPARRFLLSGRGYGLFVHTQARLTADLGTRSPTAYTLTAGEPTLDLLLFPASWPRTALSACADLLGRAPLPPARAFGLLASPA